MVAAEFWEQGDLERTVLDQQPIVRALNYVFYIYDCCLHCICCHKVITIDIISCFFFFFFFFSRWWTGITLMSCLRCSVVSSILSALLCTRYLDINKVIFHCLWIQTWSVYILFIYIIFFPIHFHVCLSLYLRLHMNLCVCRSFLASTQRSPPCSMGWISTGESGEPSQMSTRPRWRPSKTRRKGWKVETNKVSTDITPFLLILYPHCHASLTVGLICSFYSSKRREVKDVRCLLDLQGRRSIYECLSACVCVQCVCMCMSSCSQMREF